MLLSIEVGKLRHSGCRGLSVGTGSSPCHHLPPWLAWPQVEIFIKPIRDQKEFSKRQSYVTSPRPPRTSPSVIGLVWGEPSVVGLVGGTRSPQRVSPSSHSPQRVPRARHQPVPQGHPLEPHP